VIDRRSFIGALVRGIVIVPLAVSAQTATPVRRIGWLVLDDLPTLEEFKQMLAPLRELGWIEGHNLIVERRSADGRPERLQSLAEDLVRLKVELIVTSGTAAALAAKLATDTIPIVMRSVGDPVRAGLVASLSRPGGNITGYSVIAPDADVKRLELLRELLPGLQRVAYLENSKNPYFRIARTQVEQACRSLRMQPIFVEVGSASELERAFNEIHRQQAQAILVGSDDLFFMDRIPIMSIALRYSLPSISSGGSRMLNAGALLTFSESVAELRRRGAAFIDRILRGAKPGDLPIEQPTQFNLGINLKTAKALGIVVPQSLLVRADEVIQ
jgi:putative ABC transport system substrate-binding protein